MNNNKILKELAKKYNKDVRVINTVTRHPFKFLYDVMEDPYDNTPVRIMYLGVFTQKMIKNKINVYHNYKENWSKVLLNRSL